MISLAVVWLTNGTFGTPHAAALQTANPGLATWVHEGPDSGHDAWKNCDRNIREWWRQNRTAVAGEWVLFLEWDVLCDVSLEDVVRLPGKRTGMVVAKRLSAVANRRSWLGFSELNKLPREVRELALGCVPSAVLLLSRAALDAVADERWDATFEADILSELRLGTLVRASGFVVEEEPLWAHVGTIPLKPDECAGGIYHPVKMEVRNG